MSENKNQVNNSHIQAGGNVHIGDVINITQHVAQEPPQAVPVAVKQIRDLIAKSRLREALEHVLTLTSTDSHLQSQAIELAQRWNRLRTDERRGLISFSEAGLENNRIVAGMLDLLREAENV